MTAEQHLALLAAIIWGARESCGKELSPRNGLTIPEAVKVAEALVAEVKARHPAQETMVGGGRDEDGLVGKVVVHRRS
jgi:hypothetical protein